jgi:hypothetical protein
MTNIILFFKSLPTFLYNLLFVARKSPEIIALVKALIEIIGSEAVKQIVTAVRDTLEKLKKESPEPIIIPQEEPIRLRLIDRLKQRIGLAWLGMSEADYTAFCQSKNIAGQIHLDA